MTMQSVSSTSRADVAAAIRNLGHMFIERELGTDDLDALCSMADRMAARVGEKPSRTRSTEDLRFEIPSEPPPDGSDMDHFASCPVSGQENPLGLAVNVRRDGLDVVATAVFRVCRRPRHLSWWTRSFSSAFGSNAWRLRSMRYSGVSAR